jgi:hypothetical protein
MKLVSNMKIRWSLACLVWVYSALGFAQELNAPPPNPNTNPATNANPSSPANKDVSPRPLLPGQLQVKVTSVTPTVVPPQEGSGNTKSSVFYTVNFEYSGQIFTTQLPYDPGEYLVIQSTPPAPLNGPTQSNNNVAQSGEVPPGALAPNSVTSPPVIGNVQPIYIVPPPELYSYPYPYPYPFGFGGFIVAYPYRWGGGFYPGYYHGGWAHHAGFGGGGRGHGRR